MTEVLPAVDAVADEGADAGQVAGVDPGGLADKVMSSPTLRACLSGALGFSGLMELAARAPTGDEERVVAQCFAEEPAAAATPADARAPEKGSAASGRSARPALTKQTALTPPEGVPWYDGPLFDTHMHTIGLTNPIYGDLFSTGDVGRLIDRHFIEKAIGFYLPPLTGRQSEVELVTDSVNALDDRVVALLMPSSLDFGFSFGFIGFADGTYTEALLDPWFQPRGIFDGFGEIPYYVDYLRSIAPNDYQLDEVYLVVANSGGVVMMHPDQGQSTADFVEVMEGYPEITFLYHGSRDMHETENHRKVIMEMLDPYKGDNFFYTQDSGSTMHAPELEEGTSIQMDSESSEQFAEFVERFGMQWLAEHAFNEFSPVIIDNPDRMMWGTYFISSWHFEDLGSDLIIDFSRRYIGMLPEGIQKKFA